MQKRIMALLLAFCLTLTCVPGALADEPEAAVQPAAGSEAADEIMPTTAESAEPVAPAKLNAPAGLTWNPTVNGEIKYGCVGFLPVEGAIKSLNVKIYCNGNHVIETDWTSTHPTDGANGLIVLDMVRFITKSGSYTFTVTAKGDGVTTLDSDTVTSEVYNYVLPGTVAGPATDLHWDPDEPSTAAFTLGDNSDGYNLLLYYSPDGGTWYERRSTWVPKVANTGAQKDKLLVLMQEVGAGYYCFCVQPLSSNIEQVGNGEKGGYSEAVYFDGTTASLIPEDNPHPSDPGLLIPIDEEHFPDANLRSVVKEKDSDNDGNLSNAEIGSFTTLFLYQKNVADLTGVEYLTELINLEAQGNALTKVDLSHNTKLKTLSVVGNQLTELDLSANTALEDLQCSLNDLKTLNVSGLTNLTQILAYRNENLSELDVSGLQNLMVLECSKCGLSSLDVTHNTKLQTLSASENKLTTLDISKNPDLESLWVTDNQLTKLDLTGHTKLAWLRIGGNALEALDLSGCTGITTTDMEPDEYVTWWQNVTAAAPATFSAFGEMGYTIDLNGVLQPETLKKVTQFFDPNDQSKTYTAKDGKIFIPGESLPVYQLAYAYPTGVSGPAASMQVRFTVKPAQTFYKVVGPAEAQPVDGTSSASFTVAAKIKINDVLVDGSSVKFTVTEDSDLGTTTVTVPAEALNDLANGPHMFELTGDDGVYGYVAFTTVKTAKVTVDLSDAEKYVEDDKTASVTEALAQAAQTVVQDESLNAADTVTVELKVKDGNTAKPQDNKVVEEFKNAAGEKNKELKFYDISIVAKVTKDGVAEPDEIPIPSTNEPIEISLPAPTGNAEGFVFVLHKHGNEEVSEVENCKLEGDHILFSSNTFSPFAVAIADDLSKVTLDLKERYMYEEGKAVEPEIKFANYRGSKTWVEGTDFEVEYANNTTPGTGIIMFRGLGEYAKVSKVFQFAIYDPNAGGGSSGGPGGGDPGNNNSGNTQPTAAKPAASKPATAPVAPAYTGTIPQTADEFPLGGAVAAFGLSLAGLGALLLLRKKQR